MNDFSIIYHSHTIIYYLNYFTVYNQKFIILSLDVVRIKLREKILVLQKLRVYFALIGQNLYNSQLKLRLLLKKGTREIIFREKDTLK